MSESVSGGAIQGIFPSADLFFWLDFSDRAVDTFWFAVRWDRWQLKSKLMQGSFRLPFYRKLKRYKQPQMRHRLLPAQLQPVQGLWQLTRCLVCVDEGFTKELFQITDEPSKPLDMSSAPSDVRQRSAKLYGLLAGLVKNRALAIVRAAPPGDGFEALRQLTLSMRPNIQARGLVLLSTVTAWPGFVMSKPLQAQLL